MSDVKQMNPSVAFFHPTKSGNGFGVIFEFSPYKGAFFATYMPEFEGGFSKNRSVTVALGPTDIGEFLAVLKGMKDGIGPMKEGKWGGIYHNQESRNISTIIQFTRVDDDNGITFSTSVSQKVGDGSPRRAAGRLTIGEAALLLAFFESNMTQYFVAAQESRLRRKNEGQTEQTDTQEEPPAKPSAAPTAPSKTRPTVDPTKAGGKAAQKALADDGSDPF